MEVDRTGRRQRDRRAEGALGLVLEKRLASGERVGRGVG